MYNDRIACMSADTVACRLILPVGVTLAVLTCLACNFCSDFLSANAICHVPKVCTCATRIAQWCKDAPKRSALRIFSVSAQDEYSLSCDIWPMQESWTIRLMPAPAMLSDVVLEHGGCVKASLLDGRPEHRRRVFVC